MNIELNLSDHFTLKEAVRTAHTDLDNSPNLDTLKVLHHTAFKMEQVRQLLGNNPIKVNSWYRSPKVNKRVGGSSTSQHMKGEAVDFTCAGYGTPYEICQTLAKNKFQLNFDQLIYEGEWVHISFIIPPRVPRLEVLTYMLDKSYHDGLVLSRKRSK